MNKNDLLKTPEWVYQEFGNVDLDPCAGFDTAIAETNWAIERNENGLYRKWVGFVYCNPPFSKKELWIKRMMFHRNGILLLPERGSAPWFGSLARSAGYYWVMGKKINFIGGSSSNNVGSVLFLFGDEAKNRILNSRLPGHLVEVLKYRSRECA